jgi:hypothetical protein
MISRVLRVEERVLRYPGCDHFRRNVNFLVFFRLSCLAFAMSFISRSCMLVRQPYKSRDEEGVTLRPPTVKMQPRAGQQHHLIALPAELEGMPLKEIHSGFRLVHGVDGPRLERITG